MLGFSIGRGISQCSGPASQLGKRRPLRGTRIDGPDAAATTTTSVATTSAPSASRPATGPKRDVAASGTSATNRGALRAGSATEPSAWPATGAGDRSGRQARRAVGVALLVAHQLKIVPIVRLARFEAGVAIMLSVPASPDAMSGAALSWSWV